MSGRVIRLFVPLGSIDAGRLILAGVDAQRAYQMGARQGTSVVALDNSGWESEVELEAASPARCAGRVVRRSVAAERRTKISVFHGLLEYADFQRLVQDATSIGVVAVHPLIADATFVRALTAESRFRDTDLWPELVRRVAETSGRGRLPEIGPVVLFSQALDQARQGGATLLLHSGGAPIKAAVAQRPFSIQLFCASPGGFSASERAAAMARGIEVVRSAADWSDPIGPAMAALARLYELLEPEAASTP